MAVRSSNFEIAATEAAVARPAEENVVELTHGGGRFSLWRNPTPGSFSTFQMRLSRSDNSERAFAVDHFYGRLILTPEEVVAEGRVDAAGVSYADRVKAGGTAVGLDQFLTWIEDDVIDESVLVELLSEVVELHSGFPTPPPPASSASPTTSGPSSTARSRRVASTPSS